MFVSTQSVDGSYTRRPSELTVHAKLGKSLEISDPEK